MSDYGKTVVNDSLRNKILDDLSEHFSRDILSVEEYERRVQAVYKASNDTDLMRINDDLIPPEKYATDHTRQDGIAGFHPGARQCIAIFSGSTIKGEFDAPDHLDSVAIFGGCTLDLRDAKIPPGGMDIEVAAIFGGVDIKLPRDCDCHVQITAIFGGVNNPPTQKSSSRPLIRIHGAAIFGGVDIKY